MKGAESADVDYLPGEIWALKYFTYIVPYAFKQNESISTSTKLIDELLAKLLTGIDNKDKISQVAGIRFKNFADDKPRVWYF